MQYRFAVIYGPTCKYFFAEVLYCITYQVAEACVGEPIEIVLQYEKLFAANVETDHLSLTIRLKNRCVIVCKYCENDTVMYEGLLPTLRQTISLCHHPPEKSLCDCV